MSASARNFTLIAYIYDLENQKVKNVEWTVSEDKFDADIYYGEFNNPKVATGSIYIPTQPIKSKIGKAGDTNQVILLNKDHSPFPLFKDDMDFLSYIAGALKEFLGYEAVKKITNRLFKEKKVIMALLKLPLSQGEIDQLRENGIRVIKTTNDGECVSILDIYTKLYLKKFQKWLEQINKFESNASEAKENPTEAKQEQQPKQEQPKPEPVKKEDPELAELKALYLKMIELHQKRIENQIPQDVAAHWRRVKTTIKQLMDNFENKPKNAQFNTKRSEYLKLLKQFDEKIAAAKNPDLQKKPKKSSYAKQPALRQMVEASAAHPAPAAVQPAPAPAVISEQAVQPQQEQVAFVPGQMRMIQL